MMGLIFQLSLYFIVFVTCIAIFNLLSTRTIRPSKGDGIRESISILVPLRNEAENVNGVIHSLINQQGLHDFEVIALDDASTDRTRELLNDISDSRLSVIDGAELPEGWLGKNFACHQLALRAHGEILVFVDADVRLSPYAVNNSIHAMRKWRWSFISPYPRQIAITFVERLAQPLLQWSWFATLPLRIAELASRPSMVVANGQFLIMTRAAYLQSGGHEAIKSEVLDDLELARSMIRSGFRGNVAEASAIAECRMYASASELLEGYAKSQWKAFGNPVGAVIASLILFMTCILPICVGVSGDIRGWYGYFAIALTRILVGLRTRSTLSSALLHPISAGLWIYLIVLSWIRKANGTLVWRGRSL